MSSEQVQQYLVSLSVDCKSATALSKAAEVLARTGAGLALEGMTVSLSISEWDTSSEEVGDAS